MPTVVPWESDVAWTALISWHYFCAVLPCFVVYFLHPLFVHFSNYLSVNWPSQSDRCLGIQGSWLGCRDLPVTLEAPRHLRHPCTVLDLMQSSSLMTLCSSFLLCCNSLSLETCLIKEPIVRNFEMVSSLGIACILRASSSKSQYDNIILHTVLTVQTLACRIWRKKLKVVCLMWTSWPLSLLCLLK